MTMRENWLYLQKRRKLNNFSLIFIFLLLRFALKNKKVKSNYEATYTFY